MEVAALSADPPEASATLKDELRLPFTLLCEPVPSFSDPEQTVIASWGLLNRRERGGIAYPALFVLHPDLRVRYRSLDDHAARVHAGGLLEFLRSDDGAGAAKAPRKAPVLPGPMDWWKGIRNYVRLGRPH